MILIKPRNRLQWVFSWVAIILNFTLLNSTLIAAPLIFDFSGHTKGHFVGQSFPDNSLFNDLSGSQSLNFNSDFRLSFRADSGPWSFESDYQLFALYGDQVEYSRDLSTVATRLPDRLINDRRRLLQLTNVIEDKGKFAAVQRFDRLSIAYTGDKAVIKLGRQALSWGNGMFFTPMDIVNPFDPTIIDTEYKTGDDMLYGQYLLNNGDDIQSAVVVRTNPLSGHVESGQKSYAIKYHGFIEQNEYDILLAQNYGDITVGFGGNKSLGGAIWQTDVVFTKTESSTRAQIVTNISYFWQWADHNVSGLFEYYHNGFGQSNKHYDSASLGQNTALVKKLSHGEVYTLGRHYLAVGLSIEMTLLWSLSPNVFANLEDHSILLQMQTQYSLGDNLTFLGSLNIPIGPAGSEYGGIKTQKPGKYFSTGAGIFAQLAWYF